MKHRFLSAVSAAALSMSLLSGPALAQDLGLQQLQDSARISMSGLGMDTAVIETLSADQLAQIETITSQTGTDEVKVGQIETVIEGSDMTATTGGAVTEPAGAVGDVSAADLNEAQILEATVVQRLGQIGLGTVDVQDLTLRQLMQIQLIVTGGDTMDTQREQVEQIVAGQ